MKYVMICKIDMTFIPKVAEIVASVNRCMADFGYDEKMGLESTAPLFEVTVSRELTDAEKTNMITTAQEILDKDEMLKKFRIVELRQV